MNRTYHVYIVASGRNGTLYVGMTGNIRARGWQHHSGAIEGFTKRYGVKKLVYMEAFSDVKEAIAREKAIKKWRRAWKLELIERDNPQWLDLFDTLNG
jgi:putative endonuclease